MKEKYLEMLVNQFAQAKGIKNIDVNSKGFIEEFSMWIRENQTVGNTYLSFIDSFGVHPTISSYDTVEVGKGQHDSIAKDNGILLLTPFTDGIDEQQIALPSQFAVYDGVPFSLDYAKGNNNLTDLTDTGIRRFMTQNPYTPASIKRWEQLHNCGGSNITVGIFGDIHDKDYAQKIAMMKDLRSRIEDDSIVEDYATDRDSYFYALSSTRKVKTLTKTR